jgi:hypothetical protein
MHIHEISRLQDNPDRQTTGKESVHGYNDHPGGRRQRQRVVKTEVNGESTDTKRYYISQPGFNFFFDYQKP